MGFKLTYNHLNLPSNVVISADAPVVSYTYDALGNKLQKISTHATNNRNYVAGIEYKSDNSIDLIHTSEGTAFKTGNAYVYHYNLQDHLGNVRATIRKVGTQVEVLQKDDYYPFGKQRSLLAGSIENKYLYNGKEKQAELGGQYDYGARFYDAEIARFNVIDRFAEKYYSMTPYQYGGLDPIKHIDVNGDSLLITHRTGFLGLGGKQTLRYEGGNLYNQDGSAYTGKVKGFLKSTVSNLDKIGSRSEGRSMLSEIESSTSNVTIVRGSEGNKFSLGTNTVTFDPNSSEGGLNTRGSRDRPSFIGLGHELAHGLDNIRGTINLSRIPGQDFTYAEHFATHMENKLRAEHFLPLREYYKFDVQTGFGIYPLINSSGESLYYNNYNYYKQHGLGSGLNTRGIVPSTLLTPIKSIKLPNMP